MVSPLYVSKGQSQGAHPPPPAPSESCIYSPVTKAVVYTSEHTLQSIHMGFFFLKFQLKCSTSDQTVRRKLEVLGWSLRNVGV